MIRVFKHHRKKMNNFHAYHTSKTGHRYYLLRLSDIYRASLAGEHSATSAAVMKHTFADGNRAVPPFPRQ